MARTAKVKVEFCESVHGLRLKQLLKEVSGLKFQMESIRDSIKDIKLIAKDELGLEPKKFNQLANIYHNASRDQVEQENEEVIELYDKLFK